jgi:hypothetical protein
MTFQIIHPERRTVTAAQIDSWYSDARANDELRDDGSATDPYDQAMALQDAGVITLASWKPEKPHL